MSVWLITDATSPVWYTHLAAMSQTAQWDCGPSGYRRHLMFLTFLVFRRCLYLHIIIEGDM